MKKSIAWILTTIMMLALLTGCGSKSAKSDAEYVKKNGKLIVGITDYEPMDLSLIHISPRVVSLSNSR